MSTATVTLGVIAWIAAGLAVPWLFFALNRTEPDPITPENAARPMRGLGWLYAVAFVLAILASMAYPMGYAP